jgi:hypothetical protein
MMDVAGIIVGGPVGVGSVPPDDRARPQPARIIPNTKAIAVGFSHTAFTRLSSRGMDVTSFTGTPFEPCRLHALHEAANWDVTLSFAD